MIIRLIGVGKTISPSESVTCKESLKTKEIFFRGLLAIWVPIRYNGSMAILNTTSSLEYVPLGAVNLRDISDKYRQSDFPENWKLYIYETHNGLCLHDYERNYYDDSDFMMTVWNLEKNEPEDICFATTRGWTYPSYGSKPDATPEIQEKYAAWKEVKRIEALAAAEAKEAVTPRKGKTIRVVRGRKVPIGTVGVVFWVGSNRFGVAVGLKDETGTAMFTSIKNVEVV